MTQKKDGSDNSEQIRKIHDYKERHRFWTGQTLTQFGAANNFFIVIGIALLGYFLKELDKLGKLTSNFQNPDSKATLLAIASFTIFVSILCGVGTLLSRLYDLRLTRHKNFIKINGYKEKNDFQTFDTEYIDIRSDLCYITYFFKLFWKFIGSLTRNDYFVKDEDFKNGKANEKYRELHERTLMLGSFSWMNFGWQIFWTAMSILSFILIWIIGK